MADFTISVGDADTYIIEVLADTNDGMSNWVSCGLLNKTDERRGLLRVDFSSDIPAGATIDTADLYMYVYSLVEDVTGAYWGYRIKTENRDWVETEATWNIYKTDNAWESVGCKGPNDIDNTISFGSWGVSVGWISVDVVTFLQDAVDNRSRVFDALLMCVAVLGEGEDSYHSFYSRQKTAYEWYITGTYTPAAPPAGDILKISGVDWGNVKKVSGVAEASIKKVSGVTAN